MIKILSIIGARPQIVKASVLRQTFFQAEGFSEILLHTGQHYDHEMSALFFEQLGIPAPDIQLEIHGGSHAQMTARMLEGVETALLEHKPDGCLVYGDTNSTLAGALCAAKLHIPIIHVEAGLRSFDKRMPEEINRITTDHVSDILFSPTQAGVINLANEGLKENVHNVGDIMLDAVTLFHDKIDLIETVEGISLSSGRRSLKPIAVATVHRPSNTKDFAALSKVFDFLNGFCEQYQIVLPLHPRTRQAIEEHGVDVGDVTLIPPIGYLQMQALIKAAKLVFTDSGGLQKEAFFHKTPCITLRSSTEWVELVDGGWNRLWTEPSFLPRENINPYGEGHAADLMLDLMRAYFNAR